MKSIMLTLKIFCGFLIVITFILGLFYVASTGKVGLFSVVFGLIGWQVLGISMTIADYWKKEKDEEVWEDPLV